MMILDAPSQNMVPDEVGRAGRPYAEYGADHRTRPSGQFTQGIGWEEFTADAAIMALNGQDRPIVFILWGARLSRRQEC